ncbi:MAG TPA: DUF6084 family protein [Bryobacteraceae bacterium]|nr:DUF6084 family protein [Bryobacteraceae bacterium]
MPDLKFRVEGAAGAAPAAVPLMNFRVRVINREIGLVQMAALECRIEIEIPRDSTPRDRERMKELFGESSRWAETRDRLLWSSASLIVPPFSSSIVCDLLAPCSFDFNVAATKYFYGLGEGAAALCFHFKGNAVYETESGVRSAAVAPQEAHYSLPAAAWIQLMEHYYPASVWLRLPRETFDRFYRYKLDHGIEKWEDVFEDLLPESGELVN